MALTHKTLEYSTGELVTVCEALNKGTQAKMQGRIHPASWKHPQGMQLHLSSNLTCCGNHQIYISKWIRMYKEEKQVFQNCQFKKAETEILTEMTVFLSTPCLKQLFALSCMQNAL